MEVQSVSSAPITVAVGVFAPGHLGELTQVLDFALVDAVLVQTGRVQRRLRLLPSRVVVYFVLALTLFDQCGYLLVWGKLVASLQMLGLVQPSASGLARARRRVGPAPLRALFEAVAGPAAAPGTPGVFWRGLRLAAVDATVLALPDTAAVTSVYRKRGRATREWGYPLLRLCVLVECGTRALLAATFGPDDQAETSYATRLINALQPGMLLLADTAFDSGPLMRAARNNGAHVLIRSGARRHPLIGPVLPDGSYLSDLPTGTGLLPVRIIEAVITMRCSDGSVRVEPWRLITTLLDWRRYPAPDLIDVYHQRWEAETTFRSIKSTILDGRVLRSQHANDIDQEVWALLTVYQTIIRLTVDAITTTPATDPDRISFTTALHTARNQVITAQGITPTNTTTAIATAVLNHPTAPRRARTKGRHIKRPTSKYARNGNPWPKTTLYYTLHTEIMIFEEGLTSRTNP